jgi:hypothetical protein
MPILKKSRARSRKENGGRVDLVSLEKMRQSQTDWNTDLTLPIADQSYQIEVALGVPLRSY